MKIINFFTDVKKEVSKVTWINKKELINTAFSVFMIVGIFSIFFLAVDLLWSSLISKILG